MRHAALLLFATAVLASCSVANKSYQPKLSNETAWIETVTGKDMASVPFATIELDEFGFLWNPNQLANAVDAIDRANQQAGARGAIVVTYVHGWHNNACSDNRRDFKENFIKPLAYDEWRRTDGDPRPIVAIYIAWRGGKYKSWFDYLPSSYYDRDKVASRIAPGSGTYTLLSIMKEARQGHPTTRSIVIGHSLGGLLVEHALVPAIETSMIDRVGKETTSWVPLIDLVITINPAVSALDAQRLKDTFALSSWRRSEWPSRFAHGEGPWHPLIVNLTSEGDWATSSIMHAAKILGTLDDNYGNVTSDVDDLRQVYGRKERVLNRYAPGFDCELLTHLVQMNEEPIAPKKKEPRDHPKDACNALEEEPDKDDPHQGHGTHEAIACDAADHEVRVDDLKWSVAPGATACPTGKKHREGDPRACFRVGGQQFRFLQLGSQADYYWIARVPESVIPNHSKIFTPESYHLMRGLLSMTEAIARTENEPQLMRPSAAAAAAANLDAMSVRRPAYASASPPAHCAVPPFVGFSYTGPDGCSGNSNNDSNQPCATGSYTFSVEPPSVAETGCADVNWEFSNGEREHGMRVTHLLATNTTVTVTVAGDRTSRVGSLPMEVGGRVPKPEPTPPLPPPPNLGLEPPQIRVVTAHCSGMPPRCKANEQVDFDIVNPAERVAYTWNFGTDSSEGKTAQHKFAAGEHLVLVTARPVTGEVVTSTLKLTAIEARCTVPAPIRVEFSGRSPSCRRDGVAGPDACQTGDSIAYRLGQTPSCGEVEWQFPDKSVRGFAVEHPVDATRPYTITARLTTDGGTSTETITLPTVPPPQPCPAIQPCSSVPPVPQPLSACRIEFHGKTPQCRDGGICVTREKIVFTTVCPAAAPAIHWTFGDGSEQVHAAAEKRFKAPGDYTVTAHVGAQVATTTVHVVRRQPSRKGGRRNVYIVRKGDCLSTIAARFYGQQDWPRLWNLNRDRVKDANLIFPGQPLRLRR